MTCVAVNDRHAPTRILPRIVNVTERHNGVPGVIAWTSQRRAGSGRSASVDGSNPGWPRPGGSASRAHSTRSARAARGTGGSTAGRLGFDMNASFGPNVDRQRVVMSRAQSFRASQASCDDWDLSPNRRAADRMADRT
jgi:hypothetical protein